MKHLPSKPDDAQIAAYLLGNLSAPETHDVERYAATDPQFKEHLEMIRSAMATDLPATETEPSPSVKSKLFARTEITEDRVGTDFPPYIHAQSKVEDFRPWMAQAMAQLEGSHADFDCLPIGASDDTFTFLARMCSSIPEEVHVDELERVMVVEGFCDFVVGGTVHHCGPGDMYRIPLYTPHSAHVTTADPCYFIVQRTML